MRLVLLLLTLGACRCGPLLPEPPKECDATGAGCLSDEICLDFKCIPRPKCSTDADCQCAFQCVLPAQVCQLRPGFGQECSPAAPCGLQQVCALGVCVDLLDTLNHKQCLRETDCPVGQRCDTLTFFCIDDAPCTFATSATCPFPEAACDPNEVCDAVSGRCQLPCQNQCTTDPDCLSPVASHCNGSCQCVECIGDADCGPGLHCDERAGLCRPDNLCFSDADCTSPLICDQATQLCQVAPPACESDFDCAVAQVCDIQSQRCVAPKGPCPRDFLEESDTPSSAHPVDPANPGNLHELSLCPGDDDVFSLALHAGDLLEATLSNTDPHAHATAWLLDSSGETSLRFAETPPLGNGVITYVSQVDETVYLRLNALTDQTSYDLDITLSSGAICVADFFDQGGPNDALATATPPGLVPDGIPLGANICPGDQDLYRVGVAAGEALDAVLAFNGAQTDLDLAFLDDTGAPIALDSSAREPEHVRHRFASASSVYVRVRGFGNDTGDYTLTVTHEPPFVCQADGQEPDNDTASARTLPLGGGLAGEAHTMCAGDADELVVPLEDFERLIVSALYDDADVELTVDVLDATGTTVLKSSPPATGGAAVAYDAQGNETVVVRVTGTGGGIGAYSLDVVKENQLDCAPDALEPNDTVLGRGPLPSSPGQLLSICDNDQDFYAVDGTAGRKLSAHASFRQADGDIDLILLGLDGQQILGVADGTGDGEQLDVLLPLDGTYTLRVFSLTSGTKVRYTLDARVVSP